MKKKSVNILFIILFLAILALQLRACFRRHVTEAQPPDMRATNENTRTQPGDMRETNGNTRFDF